MASETVTPSDTGSGPAGLTSKLLAAWLFGLLYGIGLFLPILAVITLAGAGAATFGSFSATGWILFAGVGGLLSVAIGPVLMGRYMTRQWRGGLATGLLAVIAGVLGLVTVYLASGRFDKIIASSPGSFFSMLVALSAAAAIATIIVRARAPQNQSWAGLGVGLLIGLALAAVYSLVVAPRILQGDNTLHMVWQVPTVVWVSAAYFSHWNHRAQWWKVLPVWGALQLISFGLPFLFVPVLKALGVWF